MRIARQQDSHARRPRHLHQPVTNVRQAYLRESIPRIDDAQARCRFEHPRLYAAVGPTCLHGPDEAWKPQ